MKIGTKSVLYGAHCFFMHPIFVAIAWTKLYGFPFDPRIWIAFFVHDLGYLGKPNMDGPEGEAHVELGAKIMSVFGKKWSDFSMYHSRYYAKKNGAKPSKLCFADKLSFCYTPRWLYLPMVNATGEIKEYLSQCEETDQTKWHTTLCGYMKEWVETHKDGSEDTWTSPDRHADIKEEPHYSINKTGMTEREEKLLEIAKEILELNKHINPALTGSLMLAVRGVDKPREANDIDIICEHLLEHDYGRPIAPIGFEFVSIDGSKSQVDAVQFKHKDTGVKIDFMWSDEVTECVDGIQCGQVKELMHAKKFYADNDLSEVTRSKHQSDIDYLKGRGEV